MTQDVYKGLDDESRQMVVDTVLQLRKKLLSKEKILEWDKNEIFPEAVIREMLGPDIGLQLLFIPEEYGGMGGGARDCCAVTKEMAKICLGVGTAFFAIQLGSDPILVGATPEQKEKWLGAIAQGGVLVAYAVTEPEAGSNLAALKTKAEPVTNSDGEITGYKLNGTKQFISNGGYADLMTVLANTPDGPSFFVVEKGMKGLEQHNGEEKHGIRASNTSPLTFTDVHVPKDSLVGIVPGLGLKQANRVFGYTRLMVACMALGAGQSALDIAIGYAKERIQFGSPLSEKQGYTHKLIIPHVIGLAAAEAYIDDVADMLDSSNDDLQVEGAVGKYFATEAADRAANDCIQALGGYGYINEFEVEKIKRDIKITCIYEGTSEIQQNIISTFRWKTSRKTKGQFYNSIAEAMTALNDENPELGGRYVAQAAKALNYCIDFAHKQRLTRQQAVMFDLSDMMSYTEVGASLLRKANRLIRENHDDAQLYKAMANAFAGETAQLVAEKGLKIVLAMKDVETASIQAFMTEMGYSELILGRKGWAEAMDRVADIVFER
ncbi:MAG: acyl-CoA dehydrogenase [Desulfobacteraceae bacterium]|nr:acyl-CoA dehydrogenase [Desulfobacteraceae bacterium]